MLLYLIRSQPLLPYFTFKLLSKTGPVLRGPFFNLELLVNVPTKADPLQNKTLYIYYCRHQNHSLTH
jgi:hypothetical protein